jgi:hypothetical protein
MSSTLPGGRVRSFRDIGLCSCFGMEILAATAFTSSEGIASAIFVDCVPEWAKARLQHSVLEVPTKIYMT